MRAVIYYFSGTRNTQMVCEEYCKQLSSRNVECVLHPMWVLESIPNPNEFDLVGFAYPIHGFNAPYVVYKFLRSLPKAEGKKYFVLKTSGEPIKLNNASSIHLVDKLKRCGFSELTNEYHYVMPYNMIFRHTDLQAQKMWQTAQALIPIDAEEILSGKKSLLKRPFFGRTISWVLRIEHSAMKVNGSTFKVKDNCVKCMKCVNNCPVKNISYNRETGKFIFGNKCVMCARCSFNCPKDAIKIGILNGWRVNGAYNFENPDTTQTCKKPNYCKKAYERYFAEAEAKIDYYNGHCQHGENNVVKC